MKTLVISYSFTGNNNALAKSIASEYGADHFQVKESRRRGMARIALDILFKRIPKVPRIKDFSQHELVILMGPVWMGQAATPLRAYFKQLKGNSLPYVFISISGGADGPNTKLAEDLRKRTGRDPVALLDLHIADLLPPHPKPTRKDTSDYRITDNDVKVLTAKILKSLEGVIAAPVM